MRSFFTPNQSRIGHLLTPLFQLSAILIFIICIFSFIIHCSVGTVWFVSMMRFWLFCNSLLSNYFGFVLRMRFCFRIKQLMSYTWTSYSLVIMHKDAIYAVRDPFGNRPLCLGKLFSNEMTATHTGMAENLFLVRCSGMIFRELTFDI